MLLTKNNLKEIKAFVNKGFGLKVSYPKMSTNQTLIIYKEYLIRPAGRRRSPGERYISTRNLKPGQKLSPGISPRNYKVNNMLLELKNGKSSSPRSSNKKSASAGKRPPSAKR